MTERIEKRDKAIAVTGTILFHALIFIAFLFYIIYTPIPPFEPGSGPGLEIALGTLDEGSGNSDGMNIGDQAAVSSEEKKAAQASEKSDPSDGDVITSDVEESVQMKNDVKKKNDKKNAETVKTKTEPKPQASSDLLNAIKMMKEKRGNTSGGQGTTDKEGHEGDPNGTPGGTGTGGNEGPANSKGWTYNLSGRSISKRPDHDQFANETGKIVVEIFVDETGKVTEANPGVRGSTSTSSELKARARQAALTAKFNPSPGAKVQKGTITIIFTY